MASVALAARHFCVAALDDIDVTFVWQAWYFLRWKVLLCGRRGHRAGSGGGLGCWDGGVLRGRCGT